jgi:hypothetical protein
MWLANRARNALQRPVFIGAISVSTFVTAIVSMVVVPRTQRKAEMSIPHAPRPDTVSVAAGVAMARVQLVRADSALTVVRGEVAAAALAKPPAADTVNWAAAQKRDSIESHLRVLEKQLARTEQAPLPSSYKALAQVPEVHADPRVRPLVDSLTEIEREREGFGAVGGVDPIFVALTSRANEIGRGIQGIATQLRDRMRSQLAELPEAQPEVEQTPVADTTAYIATTWKKRGPGSVPARFHRHSRCWPLHLFSAQ